MNNKSRVVLITGACGGIGKALVNKYLSQGASIAIADKSEEDSFNLSEEIQKKGGNSYAFPGDLLDQNYCNNLANEVNQKLGKIDTLINNAGVMRRGDITQASDEDFELSMKINVEAPFRLIRAAIPLMAKAGGGSIVNISSDRKSVV